jgi:KRAB domain-containing zinc finger protein
LFQDLENEVFEALYPETEIVENNPSWGEQKCVKCGETFGEKERPIGEKHSCGGKKKAFMCEVCGKSFAQRSGLSHHLPMHSVVKLFTCDVCGKTFRQRSGLTHHKQTHSAVKAFTCSTCGKSFAQGSGLIHHRSTHSKVKSFACHVCGKSFAQRSGLAHHKTIHVKKIS